MRILYMGNNFVALEVLKWLMGRGEHIVGLVVHPEGRAKYRKEIIEASQLTNEYILLGSELGKSHCIKRMKELAPDIILSIFFGYILRREVIQIPKMGCINLHPAYLPYNRGQYPNVWSIVEESPAGATLHYIDSGIDTGDIIARKEVKKDFTDTGEMLYRKLETACIELFKESWEAIRKGTNARIKQPREGTHHKTSDVTKIDRIDLNQEYQAKYLLNVLRARTFPPYESAYVELDDGRKIYIRVSLEEAKGQP